MRQDLPPLQGELPDEAKRKAVAFRYGLQVADSIIQFS